MTVMVLDTSVLVKLFLEEELSDEVFELLIQGREANIEFKASELVMFELGNAIWKYHRERKGYGSEMMIQTFLLDIERFPLEGESAIDALKIGHNNTITFYDAVHVELAQNLGALLVTNDKELLEKFDFAIGISAALESLE